jgi:hypothetical protein
MEERGDGFVLCSVVLQDEACYGQEVGEVWDGRTLAQLVAVQIRRQLVGRVESFGEFHERLLFAPFVESLARVVTTA